MSPVDPDDRTEPVTQLTPAELVAGEISLRPWPLRLGPADLDILRDLEAGRQALQDERAALEDERAALEHERAALEHEREALEHERETARREGLALGMEEARHRTVERLDELGRQHALELEAAREELVRRVPRIASRLAATALGREVTLDPDAWRDWLLAMIERLLPAVSITVHHHPADAGRVGALLESVRPGQSGLEFIARADGTLESGEVILETPSVRVDARLSSLAAAWERELEQVFHENRPR